jgi:alkylated DNA repair protein alkB homolog 1
MDYVRKSTHAALDTKRMLDKKLRWMTLGGQYDWTNKMYPAGPPPPFPDDIKKLVDGLFPMKAEAAIVNLYSPGDTLSAHRDVSEACAQPLVSISLGCEAVFIVGVEDQVSAPAVPAAPGGSSAPSTTKYNMRSAVLRLHSGDAVLMSGQSRYAWHGLPRVMPDTCPAYLQDWPATGSEDNKQRYAAYKGWMKGKRVNLNVRQMFGSSAATETPDANGCAQSA